MTSPRACPFCAPAPDATLAESAYSRAVRDRYPLALGHTLVVPRRHVKSVFELSQDEWDDLWALVRRMRAEVPALRDADGVNVGFNHREAAGQTVEHAHVHMIPRTRGDVADPRGGIRWVIPERADYWSNRPAGEGT